MLRNTWPLSFMAKRGSAPSGYTAFRVRCSTNNSGAHVAIYDVEFRATFGGADLTPVLTGDDAAAISSGDHGTNLKWKVFDSDTSLASGWESTFIGDSWVGYNFNIVTDVKQVAFITGTGGGVPLTGYIDGYNPVSSSWVQLCPWTRGASTLVVVQLAPPVFDSTPVVSGNPNEGSVLSCAVASSTDDDTPSYQWRQDGVPIVGATGATYTPVAGDQTHNIDCYVTIDNFFGSTSMASNSVGPIGPPLAFDPADLFSSGEKGFIYDPTDPSTLFQNYAGTGAVASSSDPVGYITDLSGNGNHAKVQGNTTSRRALYNVDSGVAALLFDGSDDAYELPTTLETGMSAGHLLYAGKRTAVPTAALNSGPVMGQSGSSTTSDHQPYISTIYHGFMSTLNRSFTAPASMTNWHTGEFISASGNWKHRVDGTDVHSDTSNTVATSTVPLIGSHQRNRGDSGVYWEGRIGRMIFIDRVLSGTELNDARDWIAAGY